MANYQFISQRISICKGGVYICKDPYFWGYEVGYLPDLACSPASFLLHPSDLSFQPFWEP